MEAWYGGEAGGLVLNRTAGEVRWRGMAVHLTPHQFRIFACLVKAKGKVVLRKQLVIAGWGFVPAHRSEDLLRAHISGIRRALRRAGLPDRFIQNVWGGSYRLTAPH